MVTFWANLVEENNVDCKQLGRALAALDKLENDVGNHGLVVLERRFSSDRWAGQMVQQKKETR